MSVGRLPAREAVHARGIVRRNRRRSWCGAAHHTADAFEREPAIGNVTSPCRSPPAVAPEDVKNLLAFQGIGRLHVPHGLHCVSSSPNRLAEGAGCDIADPVGDTALVPVFGGQRFHGRGWQVQEQAFCDHQRWSRTRRFVHCAPLCRIVQIDRERLAPAAGCLAGHQLVLVVEYAGEVDFDPAQVGREVEAPRPRVETATDAQHGRDRVCRQRFQQQLIDKTGANGESEAHHRGMRQRVKDGHTALSGQPRRERIAHEGVLQLGFERAAGGYHEGRVADVGDFAAGRGHQVHYAPHYGSDEVRVRFYRGGDSAAYPFGRRLCVVTGFAPGPGNRPPGGTGLDGLDQID